MELQTLCCALPSQPLEFSNRRSLSIGTHAPFRYQRQKFGFGKASKCTICSRFLHGYCVRLLKIKPENNKKMNLLFVAFWVSIFTPQPFDFFLISGLKWVIKEPSVLRLNKFQRSLVYASDSNVNGGLEVHPNQNSGVPVIGYNGMEPFHGKSGSVSFYGVTYQSIEEGKVESAPFKEEESTFFWVLAPAAFISALILPQFFIGNVVEAFFNDVILVDIVSSFSFEALFYIGLATFLHVADRVQRPYLQYSSKRWGLITGLRGYLYSAFLTTGVKIIAPLLLLFVTWSVVGLAAFVAIAPFLVGCVAQLAFERSLDKRGSSCWPLVPIIFEVYRLYQLTKAAHFAEKLMFSMKGLPATPEVLERSGALFAMIVTFQVLGVVCLWSLMTFLLRLFPSRPVADNY